MAISSINIAMGASSIGAYVQRLTETTRQKLEELNIPYNETTSESEGKRLLKAHETKKQNNSGDLNQDNSSSDVFKRAKKLAEQLGIAVEENEIFEKLLSKIENALQQKIESYQNNPMMLKKMNELSRELASIQAESKGSSGYDNTNQALMLSLEMLSAYNKNFLNK